MGLLSIFKSNYPMALQPAEPSAVPESPESIDPIQQARTLARHRLIGSAVLVFIGVLVFPFLFETQPRPVAIDIPIQIPRNESAPPLVIPQHKPASSHVPQADAPVIADQPEGQDLLPHEPPSGASVLEAAKPPAGSAPSSSLAAPPSVLSNHLESNSKPAASTPKLPRFVVQAGAFADMTAAQEVRSKLEKLGLKTFVQVLETSDGKRIRVRVGPLASKDQAEKVLARIKASGISAVILVL